MWIEMLMHMSGTRANGEKYPPGFTPFQVEAWEGEHLIRGGMAREVAAPRPPAPPEPVPVPAYARSQAQPASIASDPPPQDDDSQGDEPAPAPSDPKQAWVDFAVMRGMGADEASRMTKADLQSRFGGRL